MSARVDMRDEDGQVVDGWIVRMPKRGYLFRLDNNSIIDAAYLGPERYRIDGYAQGYVQPQAVFQHHYCGERHRPRR